MFPDDPFSGAGMWIWYLPEDYRALFQSLAELGYRSVYIKCGDGRNRWGQWNEAVRDTAHEYGLKANIWHYIYNEAGEHDVMFDTVTLMPDAYVLDAEYELVGHRMGDYLDKARGLMRGTPLGYAPDLRIAFANRWPRSKKFVPNEEFFDWEAFSTLDAVLPQLYYTDFGTQPDITIQLADLWGQGCMDAGWNIPPKYPILPSTSDPAALKWALQVADSYNFLGCSLWRYANGNQANAGVLGAHYS